MTFIVSIFTLQQFEVKVNTVWGSPCFHQVHSQTTDREAIIYFMLRLQRGANTYFMLRRRKGGEYILHAETTKGGGGGEQILHFRR